MQHIERDTRLDPRLQSLKSYRCVEGSFEILAVLGRHGSSARSETAQFWLPWQQIRRNAEWGRRLDGVWDYFSALPEEGRVRSLRSAR